MFTRNVYILSLCLALANTAFAGKSEDWALEAVGVKPKQKETPKAVYIITRDEPGNTIPAADADKILQRRQIKQSDLSKFIKNPKITIEGGQLKVAGLVTPSCAKELQAELRQPDGDEKEFAYGLTLSIRDSEDALKACDEKEKRSCDKNRCVSLSQNPEKLDGLKGVIAESITIANKDGDINVKYRYEDLASDAGDVKYEDFSEQFGGKIALITEAKAKRLEEEKEIKEQENLIAAHCEAAQKGDFDAIETFVSDLGEEGAEKHKDEILKARDVCLSKTMATLEKSAESAEGLKEVAGVADAASKIADVSEKDIATLEGDDLAIKKLSCGHEKAKSRVATFLANNLIVKAYNIGIDEKDASQVVAKNALLEGIAATAMKLDGSNKDQYRKSRLVRDVARLNRFTAAAMSGDDAFYNSVAQKQFSAARSEALGWAKSNPKDAQANKLAQAYESYALPRAVQSVAIKDGPLGSKFVTSNVVQGNGFDEMYAKAVSERTYRQIQSINDEQKQKYEEYMKSMNAAFNPTANATSSIGPSSSTSSNVSIDLGSLINGK